MTKPKRQSNCTIQEAKSLISGKVGNQAEEVIVNNLNGSAAALMACQGTRPELLGSAEATIVSFVVDKSGSMSEVEEQVKESVWENIKAMKESKQAEAITLSLINFDNYVTPVFANQALENIQDSDVVFQSGGSTALYDAVLDALTGAITYQEMLLDAGVQTKVIIVVFSDGADNESRRNSLSDINKLTAEIGKREEWTLAFIGFKTYEQVDFTAIAKGMGFPNFLQVDLTVGEYDRRHLIRKIFRLVSKSVIRTSQTQIGPNSSQNFFQV